MQLNTQKASFFNQSQLLGAASNTPAATASSKKKNL